MNLYEQSFSGTRSKVYRAHGLWWQNDDPLFPEFEVRGRGLGLLTAMTSAMASARDEIVFRDDPEFSARFTVHGTAEDQIRRLLTPRLRKALLEEVDQGIVGAKGHVLAWDRPGRLWGERALAKLILRAGRLRQAFEIAAKGIQ